MQTDDMTLVREFAASQRAFAYYNSKRYDNALADFATFIQGKDSYVELEKYKNPMVVNAHFISGIIYQDQKKDFPKAIAEYTAVIQTTKQYKGAYIRRGACYEALGEIEKARQDFAIEPKGSSDFVETK